MSLIIPAGFANIQINWVSPNFYKGRALTQFGVTLGAGGVSTAATDVAQAATEHLLPLISDEVVLEGVVAQSATTQSVALSGASGARTDNPAEPSIALLTKKVTNVRGPRAKGRCYWPGMVYENTFDSRGLMSDDSQEDYQDAFNAFTLEVQTDVGFLVILQNTEGDSTPISPPPQVDGLLVDKRAATQRRRLRS